MSQVHSASENTGTSASCARKIFRCLFCICPKCKEWAKMPKTNWYHPDISLNLKQWHQYMGCSSRGVAQLPPSSGFTLGRPPVTSCLSSKMSSSWQDSLCLQSVRFSLVKQEREAKTLKQNKTKTNKQTNKKTKKCRRGSLDQLVSLDWAY